MLQFGRLRKILFYISAIGLFYCESHAADPEKLFENKHNKTITYQPAASSFTQIRENKYNTTSQLKDSGAPITDQSSDPRPAFKKAIELVDTMSKNDLFWPVYPSYSIRDLGLSIAWVDYTSVAGAIIVAFRGSNNPKEYKQNHSIEVTDITAPFEMKGKCQKEYWDSFSYFKGDASKVVKHICPKVKDRSYKLTLFIGHSRGASLATLFAAHTYQLLSKELKEKPTNFYVVNCGALSIFDDAGAASFTKFAQDNFTLFWNLRAKEDLISQRLDTKLKPIKTVSEFSAKDTDAGIYEARVLSGYTDTGLSSDIQDSLLMVTKKSSFSESIKEGVSTNWSPTSLVSIFGSVMDLASTSEDPTHLFEQLSMGTAAGIYQSEKISINGVRLNPKEFLPPSMQAHVFKTYNGYLQEYLLSAPTLPLSLPPVLSSSKPKPGL